MIDVINTKSDLCTGCNRCVRECPMELANITYQDDAGDIKVRVDHDKCIVCGRCVAACKHNARYYIDDTERFFEDLSGGVPISLVVAPSIRTNIPEYKRLFTYLKKLGVKNIIDGSLGADICVWAHTMHIKRNGATPIITQPCPSIVMYCEIYHHELLDKLSPVHSPIACASIYMREYRGIRDRIAAITPCIAKTNEIRETGIAEYNVTFSRLLDYLRGKGAKLPLIETDFDQDDSRLGSLLPIPGGLKENVEFFTGKRLYIVNGEGCGVYEKLSMYAATPEDLLPDIYDVLNCAEGCSIGSACPYNQNVFEIGMAMEKCRHAVPDEERHARYDAIYKTFEDTLDLSHFTRIYNPVPLIPKVVDKRALDRAFSLMGKSDFDKQNIDCGACGSGTCLDMARKISLGVNIPINCMYHTMSLVKEEHETSLGFLEQFETIWMYVESSIMIIDAETREIIDVNPAAERLCGEPLEDIIGQKCFKYFGQHECPVLDTNLALDRSERSFTRADGVTIPIVKSAVRTHFKGRTVLLESFSDISHIRDVEEQKLMLELGERVQLMLEANPHANVLFDHDLNVIDCNPAACELLGFKSKEELLTGMVDQVKYNTPEYKSDGKRSVLMSEALALTIKEGTAKVDAEQVVNGSRRFYSADFKRIPYNNDYAIVLYLVDMTDVREREAELIHAHNLNDLQLAKLNLVVGATKIGLWDMAINIKDPINPVNTIIWSSEFRSLLGYNSESEFPNTIESLNKSFHPDDRERVEAALAAHLEDRTGKTPFDIEYRLMRKSGSYGYFRACGDTVRDENGAPIRIAGALLDVTETKNLIKEAEDQRTAADAANKAKSVFLSTMSHEIRTPMNAILGITEIQLQKGTHDRETNEAFEKVYSSGDLLLSIINDILDLSKIEAGKLELIIDKYDTASLISDTVQLNIMRIGSNAIEFELVVDENLPAQVLGDELRVKQILNNLLSNSFKYTSEGVIKLAVNVEPSETDSKMLNLVFILSDTGHGMTKEQVARLFDEYTRFNEEHTRTIEGTGLGMSITQNLLRLMEGKINVESEPGVGSTFTVHLPQGICGTETLGKSIADNLQQFRSSSRSQMKRVQVSRDPMPYGSVLIVDDVETNIYVARGLLTPYGLKLDSADSGFATIDKIKNGNIYDIIFMDHMMPQMDGIEATKRIREMGYTHPIVALTANAVSGQASIFLGNGFDDFISKPIDVRQLNSVLNKLIRDKQPQDVIEEARRQAYNKLLLEPKRDSSASSKSAIDPQAAEAFVRDAIKALNSIRAVFNKGEPYREDDLRNYTISAHGMRGALANMGNSGLSAAAFKLEQAGRIADTDVITSHTAAFIEALQKYLESLVTPTDNNESKPSELTEADALRFREKLMEIKSACADYNEGAAEAALVKLRNTPCPQAEGELLGKVSELLLHSEFDEIIILLDEYLQ